MARRATSEQIYNPDVMGSSGECEQLFQWLLPNTCSNYLNRAYYLTVLPQTLIKCILYGETISLKVMGIARELR